MKTKWEENRLHKRLSLQPQDLEKVYGILAEIDGVKNSWHITGKLLPQNTGRLNRSVIVSSTGASNRLAGKRVTDKEVEHLYKNLRVKTFTTRDEQETAGYLSCLESVFYRYNILSISEQSILRIHHDMLTHADKTNPNQGGYKLGSNRVEAIDPDGKTLGVIFDPTHPYLVKKEMQELIDWYKWASLNQIKHPLILIANFIFEYLAIHPFQDGNGRTSRLLTHLMLLQHGYLFTQIASHERLLEANKADYYLALNQAQGTWKTEKESINPWLLFFLKVVRAQCKQTLKILQGDNITYLLSEKQLTLWKWVNQRSETFSRKEAIEALGFPPRTVESIIKKLLNLNCLERLGQGKATRYQHIHKQI